jgi:hypothetical protein
MDYPLDGLKRSIWGPRNPDQDARDRHETYSVKEIFKTLQGEGGQARRAAVFCRFAGCNLWTGRGRIAPRQCAGFAIRTSSTPAAKAAAFERIADCESVRVWENDDCWAEATTRD